MRHLTRRQRIAATTLAALALAFITLDLGGASLRHAHGGVRGTFGALYRGTDSVLGPVRSFVAGIPSAGSRQDTITELRRELARARGENARLRAEQRDAATLRTLQSVADTTGRSVLPARVTAFGAAQGFDWTVTLDVGTASGVRAGQTVTDGNGVVGRVLHADASSSSVLLAADPGSGMGARDTRSGQLGIVTGAGTSGFRFAPLDPRAVVRPGDRLVTGPTGASSYVGGLPVGVVLSVRRSADGSVVATVVPAASPTGLDLVGVLIPAAGGTAAHAPLTPASPTPSPRATRGGH